MDIELKHKIAEKILQSNDENLLNEIKYLVGLSENDFWADLPEKVKTAIDKSKEEFDCGEGISHSDVMSDVKKRFLKM
jgi:hypothetical protein